MFSRSIAMPAVRCNITHGSRPEGTSCSSSLEKAAPVPSWRVSTMGASLVTVTVSCTVETSSVAFTWALKLMPT